MSNISRTKSSTFPIILTVLSLIAGAASMQLVLERLELIKNPNYKPTCDLNPFFSCSSVMLTPQAQLFGFPNPLLGIVGFAVLLTIGVMLLTKVKINKVFALGLLLGTFFGFALTMYFWYIVIFEIHHFCLYCMIVWACAVPMFFLSIVYVNEQGFLGSQNGGIASFKKWAWPTIILFYIIIYGGIWLAYLKLTA